MQRYIDAKTPKQKKAKNPVNNKENKENKKQKNKIKIKKSLKLLTISWSQSNNR